MKSIQIKGKNKKKNEKFRKVKLSTKNTKSTSRPDLSSLRKPIDTSVSDLCQVSKLLENGTDEVKSILSYECDIIYECRTCRSLFRSIVNLISHKREYCKNKFDITLHKSVLNNYNLYSAKESMIYMCNTGQTIIQDSIKNDRILRSQVTKETHKKDLSTVIDMLNKKREENMGGNSSNKLDIENEIFSASNNQHIYLEPIDTNCSAMYQTIKSSGTTVDTMDLMKGQVTELQNMTDQQVITEGQMFENQLEKSDSPIQIDMNDEENELLVYKPSMNNLACTICNTKFSTKKTLTVHMKTLHTSQRMCYPCPCCTSTFANTWSVYRHLYKVHKKTNEQVRKLRSQIQEKAFHKKTTAMKENPRATKISLENITSKKVKIQESINHIESNAELQSYHKHRQRLSRKTVLPARLQYSETPVTVRDEITTKVRQPDKTLPDNDQSDSTSNNMMCETEADAVSNMIIKPSDKRNTLDIKSGRISSCPEICEQKHETFIRVQAVSSLSKDYWDMLGNQHDYPPECNSIDNDNNDLGIVTPPMTQNINNVKPLSSDENQKSNPISNKNLQLPEIVGTDINKTVALKIKTKKRKTSSHNKKQLTDLKEKSMIEIQEDSSKLQSSCSIRSNEKSQISLMESKMASIANFQKLQCLPCKRKFTSMPNLRRHMAGHIGWNRYRCKLCDFKCFVKCDCVAHCNKMHNAQNNRAVITEIVIEIPPSEYTCNEDIMNVTNIEEKADDPDIMDITAYQTEIHINSDNSNHSNVNITLRNKAAVVNEQVTESHRNVEHQNIEHQSVKHQSVEHHSIKHQNDEHQNIEHQNNEHENIEHENIEHKNVDVENTNKTTMVQNMTDYIMNCGSGKLDTHPDLKRMVMEVIFGSNEVNATKETDPDESTLEINNDAKGHIDTDDNDNTASIDESKEASCSMSISLKHQRPTRNRIKPLSNDFIYDLKEVASRKYAFFNDSGTLNVRKKTKLCN